MEKIRNFARRYTIIYCILAEIIVLGGMTAWGYLLGWFTKDSGVDGYVLLALQELGGAMLSYAALKVSGCSDVLTKKGIGFGKGLLVGGYFLFISAYAGIVFFLTYEGERVLRPWYLIAAFVMCMFLVGVTEELLCRGTVAELLLGHYGVTTNGIRKTVIVSGILFGLAHLTNLLGAKPIGVLVQTVVASMMGMAFAAVYFRTGCIWVTVVLHALVDLGALITSGLYQGSVNDVVSSYQPFQLIAVIPYAILLLVLLRKKKMVQIIARLASDVDKTGADSVTEMEM